VARSPTLRARSAPTMHSKPRFLVDLVIRAQEVGLSPRGSISLSWQKQGIGITRSGGSHRDLPGAFVTPTILARAIVSKPNRVKALPSAWAMSFSEVGQRRTALMTEPRFGLLSLSKLPSRGPLLPAVNDTRTAYSTSWYLRAVLSPRWGWMLLPATRRRR